MKRFALALLLVAGPALADKPGDYHEYQSDPDLFMLLYTGNVAKRFKPKTAIMKKRPVSFVETPSVDSSRGTSLKTPSGNK